jgi:alanyl-tRNA synthetase
MKEHLLYLNNTYLFEVKALIVGCGEDEKGMFVTLDQTLFYPQGGGQPSDQGILEGDNFRLDVILVRQTETEIRHYLKVPSTVILNGQHVTCIIDQARRMLNAKYHTAAHLLSNVVEVLYPSLKAVKGHSFPNEAYVEFQRAGTLDMERLQHTLDEVVAADHKTTVFEIDPISFENKFYKLPYQVPNNKIFRVVEIQGFLPIPCGGTHLGKTSEIGHIVVDKLKIKNDTIRILYKVT